MENSGRTVKVPGITCPASYLQTTSLFLHWFPACVAWTERWHPDVHVREYNKKSSAAMAEWHEASLLDLVVLPMIPYLIWALLYYVKVCRCPQAPVFSKP